MSRHNGQELDALRIRREREMERYRGGDRGGPRLKI